MSEKKSANSHKISYSNIKKPSTAMTSSTRTTVTNKSEASSSQSGTYKRADTTTSATINQDRSLLSVPSKGRKKSERTSSSRKKRKGKEVAIKDTEKNRQIMINKFLESEMKIEEKTYTLEGSPSTVYGGALHGKVKGSEEDKLKANRSHFISTHRFPQLQPSITLTRDNESKSDGTLHKQALEEQVHYFSTPSASKEDLRPRSAPIHCDIHCLEDGGYARYLLDKIRTRSIHFEPLQKINIRQASPSGLEETNTSKNCTSSLHHLPIQPILEERPRRRSECHHMLPRIYSKENHQNLSIPKLLPENCLSLHHNQDNPDSMEEIKPILLKSEGKSKLALLKSEHNIQKKNQRNKLESRKRRPKTAGARSRSKSGELKQNRTSSFPLISTSSSGKTASSKFNTSFSRAYLSSEEELPNDFKSKTTTATNSGTRGRGLSETWSMPAIMQEISFTLDDKTPSHTNTESSSVSSQDIFGADNTESEGLEISKKGAENLSHCRATPSQSASSRGSKSRAGRRKNESILSPGESLPQVSGNRNDMVSTSEDSNLTLKTSSEISSGKLPKVQDKSGLSFTGTFSGTATMHSNRAAELFNYDFHVLPFSDASSSPSPPSSRRSSLDHRENTKRPKSSMRRRRPSKIEVEDLEFPTTGAAGRPKTAPGSSRSVSTKQVAFELSDSQDQYANSQSTLKEDHLYQAGKKERVASNSTLSTMDSSHNMRHRPKSTHEIRAIFPKMEPYKNQMQPEPRNPSAKTNDSYYQPKPIDMHDQYAGHSRCGYIGNARGQVAQADALSMPSRDYVDHYSQLMVWKQERMIRDVHREIDRKYGKHVYFVHPSREFLLSIFNKSVTKQWTFFEVFHEVEEYWIKPILNWHRRLYIYSLVYPPN